MLNDDNVILIDTATAKRSIIATSDSISSIAEACGFNDYCYFSHAFKKITGVSANQYRKIKRQ